MAATARKLDKEMTKQAKTQKPKLKVHQGGKAKDKAVKAADKKAPPAGKKAQGAVQPKWAPKAGEWRTVLRLPTKLSKRLKAACEKNDTSINEGIKTLVETWCKMEKV